MARAKQQISPRLKSHVYLKQVELRFQNKRFDSDLTDKSLTHAGMVYELFSDLQNETKEKLIVISLGLKNKILCFEVVAIGSLDSIPLLSGLELFKT
jgi:DNA repair protein RadC